MKYRLLILAATVIWGSSFVIVKDAVECCFEKDQILTQKVLLDSVDKTIPISDYCKDEIDQLKETLGKSTFRNALTGKIGSE